MSHYPFIDRDVQYFERVIQRKKEYVELLERYRDKRLDSAILIDSFVAEISDTINVFADCVDALKRTTYLQSARSSLFENSTDASSFSDDSIAEYPVASSPLLGPSRRASADARSSSSFSRSHNASDLETSSITTRNSSSITRTIPTSSLNTSASVQPPYRSATSAANGTINFGNACSFIVTDVAESSEFMPKLKQQSDINDVNKILSYLGIEVEIKKCYRFTPNKLQDGRAKFIKVGVATEEQKKKVVDAANANLSSIQALDQRFAMISIRDADKTGYERFGTNSSKKTFRARNPDTLNTSVSSFKSYESMLPPKRAPSSYAQAKRPFTLNGYTRGRPEECYTSDEEN